MRTDRALKNSIVSMISYFVLILFGFVTQRIFKDTLGTEYLGINGLYGNIMTGLNIVELGFGSAIVANMYRPVAENDKPKIIALMKYYRKVYHYIAIIVLTFGLCVLPFVPIIVGDISVELKLRFIFLMYLLDSVVSYFLSYKRSLLYANQESYYTMYVNMAIVAFRSCLQIFALIWTLNFYLYLIISIVFKLIENVINNVIVNTKYPYIQMKSEHVLDEDTVTDIKKKVRGLLFHKLANFVVFGTDNIIISTMPNLGIVWVGLYSNYSMITSKLTFLIDAVFNSVTASVGNMLVENDSKKDYDMFRNMMLINTWIYIFISISFYFFSFPFIAIWMGNDFVLDKATVFVVSLNLFVSGLRAPYGTFKAAGGIFYEDRYVPVIESVVNIVFSVPLAYCFGLKGVLTGTMCSTMVLFVYSYPTFVYKKIFGKSLKAYWCDFLKSIGMYMIAMVITSGVMLFVYVSDKWLQLFITGSICVCIPNLTIYIIVRKTKEYAFCRKLMKRLKLKFIRRI
nr:hypothetical protein [uncultured Acetatifactor sp.]